MKNHCSSHTGQDEEDSSGQGDLVLDVLRGSADLGALESQHRGDDGGQADQQGQDHQSPTSLQVSWEPPGRKTWCFLTRVWFKSLVVSEENFDHFDFYTVILK